MLPNYRAYKIIKQLKPTQLFEILSRGVLDEYFEKFKKEVIDIKGEWYLNNWNDSMKIDILSFYISNMGFKIFTTKEEAFRIKELFINWGLFYNVYCEWYGGKHYNVGFTYSEEDFKILYTEWLRDKKLEDLLVQ